MYDGLQLRSVVATGAQYRLALTPSAAGTGLWTDAVRLPVERPDGIYDKGRLVLPQAIERRNREDQANLNM
jgi:hypothetical protein